MFSIVKGITSSTRATTVVGDTSLCLCGGRIKNCQLGASFGRRGFSLKQVFKFTCNRGRGNTIFSRVAIVCTGTLCRENFMGRKCETLCALLRRTVGAPIDLVCPKVPRCFSTSKGNGCPCLAKTTD